MVRNTSKDIDDNAAKPKLDRKTTKRPGARDDGLRELLASFIPNKELLDLVMGVTGTSARRKSNGGQDVKAANIERAIAPTATKGRGRSTRGKATVACRKG